jgi:hypothetical protein
MPQRGQIIEVFAPYTASLISMTGEADMFAVSPDQLME